MGNKRIKLAGLTALVEAGHSNFTGYSEVGKVEDANYIKVSSEQMSWLEGVEITLLSGRVVVELKFTDDNKTAPTLTIGSDGIFRLAGLA